MWRLKLARLAVNVILAATVETILCLQSVSAAPISAIDPHSGEPVHGGSPSFMASSLIPSVHISAEGTLYSIEATGWRGAGGFFDHLPAIASVSGVFDSREVRVNGTDDKTK